MDDAAVSAHGIDHDGAVLVRPDGFVAWRSEHAVDDAAATMTSVFGELLSL